MPYYDGNLWVDVAVDIMLHARLEAQRRERENRRELIGLAFAGEFGVSYDARRLEYIMPSGRRIDAAERELNRFDRQWEQGIIEEIAQWTTLTPPSPS